MVRKLLFIKKLLLILSLNIFLIPQTGKTAEYILLENGIFSRTISIKSVEELAKTGKAKGSLKNLMRLSNQSPEKISNLLKQEYDLPLVTTSKLMYSTIGDVIILRVSKIIYPKKIKDKSIAIPAIRSGVTSGIIKGKGKLSLIQFLKSYPNKTIAINIPALNKVLKKAESMSELIKFFSGSPLPDIKTGEVTD